MPGDDKRGQAHPSDLTDQEGSVELVVDHYQGRRGDQHTEDRAGKLQAVRLGWRHARRRRENDVRSEIETGRPTNFRRVAEAQPIGSIHEGAPRDGLL